MKWGWCSLALSWGSLAALQISRKPHHQGRESFPLFSNLQKRGRLSLVHLNASIFMGHWWSPSLPPFDYLRRTKAQVSGQTGLGKPLSNWCCWVIKRWGHSEERSGWTYSACAFTLCCSERVISTTSQWTLRSCDHNVFFPSSKQTPTHEVSQIFNPSYKTDRCTCITNSRRRGTPLSESRRYSGSFSLLACWIWASRLMGFIPWPYSGPV